MESNNGWQVVILQPSELNREYLVKMFQGDFAGLRFPQVLTANECELVVNRLKELGKSRSRRYRGNLNIGTVLDIPSHWEFMYMLDNNETAWKDYFKKVGPTTRLRRRVFADVGSDPVDRVAKMLTSAWGSPVHRVKKFGHQLYVGMIRSGAPKLHFDWARFDLSEPEVVAQAGVNLYLSNGSYGGDLKVYRQYGMTKGNTASSGESVVGNYDLPQSLVRGAEYATIPCRAGDLAMSPNRFLHEVTETAIPQESRLTLSFHLVWMGNGRLAIFS